jgi:hypothetical protein
MRTTLLILVLSVIFLLALPAAYGMAADEAEFAIFNGTGLSNGLREMPAGYVPTSQIVDFLHESGYAVNMTGLENKWALVYNVSQLPGVMTIYDRITKKGKYTGIIAQVAYYGTSSIFPLEINGGWHYVGIMKDGNNLTAVEFDTLRIYPLKFKHSAPLTNFTFVSSPPADLTALLH